jgi:hypothetical protein
MSYEIIYSQPCGFYGMKIKFYFKSAQQNCQSFVSFKIIQLPSFPLSLNDRFFAHFNNL